jgi:hypothetical protein
MLAVHRHSMATLASRSARLGHRVGYARAFSMFGDETTSYSSGGYADVWPRTKSNSILNVCPMGERMIVERLGKLSSVQQPGFFICIPFIDIIAYRIDMREKAIEIEPQRAITKDNVSLSIAGNVFIEFNDPVQAAYGSFNPLYAVRQNAQSSMRAGALLRVARHIWC